MAKVNVAIVGAGSGGTTIYRMLREMTMINIVGIADKYPKAAGILLAQKDGVFNTADFVELIRKPGIDVIIEATGLTEVQSRIHHVKHGTTAVMEAQAADLMITILEEKEKLLEIKKIQGELSAILSSVQEAIEVADLNGEIKYVNPAFSRVTGISGDTRIGKNIFTVSPDGALAQAILTKLPVTGQKTQVGGSNAEVISNACPIVVDEKILGAVVSFQPVTDIMKLVEELKKSCHLIQNLNERLGQVSGSKYSFDDIIGQAPGMQQVKTLGRKAALSDSTVIIYGESGTGKELFAHALHQASGRSEKPLIKVNCAAIPESLLESEFFGHEKGAFTGAVKTKLGKFELAHGGTIFLDEIGDMDLSLQAKLLRVLQEKEIERIGGTETVKVDVRVVAATNRDLQQMVRKGEFRQDLYYRLNVVELHIPPLRERKEDLDLLINHFVTKFERKLGKRINSISQGALGQLAAYHWPGNVREMENVLERAIVSMDKGEKMITHLHIGQLTENKRGFDTLDISVIESIENMERRLIQKALDEYGISLEGKKQAASILKISLGTLYNKMKRYGY
ncbi:MAG: sigma 54-interacting transcriptional regulator [Thermincola sp.]|jgi:PAS domain S-box-containing protein|nr:sigma 54-interacting transcriptional regulator [Thermincola sp.]